MELLKNLPDYEYIRKHPQSRAILLIRKDLNKKAWINFPKFFELVNSNKEFKTEEYCSEIIQPNN